MSNLDDIRMNDYTSGELMAAILSSQEATAAGFARVDARFGQLRADMNHRFDLVDDRFDDVYARFDRMERRFDRVDQRFDRLEARVAALEPRGNGSAS